MLTPADADLARRDPTLPSLAVLLDPDAFAALLSSSIPSLAPMSVRPLYVRYKPGTRCLVAYEVCTPGGTVPVHANTYTAHRALDETAAAGRGARRGGTCAATIAAGGIVISVFPHDEALRSLARIWQPTSVTRPLKKLFPDQPTFWDAGLSVLAYKPGRRCVAALQGADGSAAILKAYTAGGFSRAVRGGRAFCSSGPLRVARMVGRSHRHHLLAFEWLPGDSLSTLIGDGSAGIDVLRRVGAALAGLHAQDARPGGGGGADLGAELRAVSAGIGWLCPDSADRAARHVLALTATLQPAADNVPLHGDFHAGQVLVGREAVSLVDMDRASHGDPRTDLATFIAHLQCDVLEGRLDPSAAQRLGDALIEGYEALARRSVHRGLEPYVAAALLRLAPHPFRTRQRDWPACVAAIVRRAESLLEKAGRTYRRRGTASNVDDPFGVVADRALSLPPAALNPAAMARRLADLAGYRRGAIYVDSVRVSRHKPGRRCLIEYDVTIAGKAGAKRVETLIAKVRARGADTRTYRLSRALWSDGFRDDSTDGVSVPRPLGVLPDLRMWIQLKIPGMPITTLLFDDGAQLAERVADVIRKLHCRSYTQARRHGIDDELRILRDRLSGAAVETPAYARRLKAISESCARIAGTLPQVPCRGIHRDFYADQVLEHDGRMYLLDLDLYSLGDPALDVGNFLGHVSEHSLRMFDDPARLLPFEAAMKDRFLALDATVSAGSIEIYKTLTLARLIQISTVMPERRRFTREIVELVEARLGEP
jgi:aminoglycoside phosphotransferase (APT) family kinase protein